MQLMVEKKALGGNKHTVPETSNRGIHTVFSIFLQHHRVCAMKQCPHKVDIIDESTHFGIGWSCLELKPSLYSNHLCGYQTCLLISIKIPDIPLSHICADISPRAREIKEKK